MAEGWARHLQSDLLEPYSAGIEMHGLNPSAVKVMAEVGVLIEVPLMLMLVKFCLKTQDWFEVTVDESPENQPLMNTNKR
jgi:arsenate reductase